MENQAFIGVFVLLIVLWLTGCVYNHKQFQTEVPSLTNPDDFVIQIDDYGQFWDK